MQDKNYIFYCFRQNSNDIKTITVQEPQTSWESLRQRIHEIHFGSFRKLVNKVSLSKYLSGICYIKAFLGTYDPSSECIVPGITELGPTHLLVPGTYLVICRTAPTQEMIVRETKLYHNIRRNANAHSEPAEPIVDDEPHFLNIPLSAIALAEPLANTSSLYRDMIQIYHMCRREGRNYRTEMATVDSGFYRSAAPVSDQPLPPPVPPIAPLKRASGIPSSLLRPAIGDLEKKNAMLDAQGNLVVYR